jgi:uncharacterized cupredoxin-like copper-binding protein
MSVLGQRGVAFLFLLAGGALGGGVTHAVLAASPPAVRTVTIVIHHSHFSVAHLEMHEGSLVRFVVRNTDPIDHELIIGDEAVQDAHEHGTEVQHHRPGEVSVPAETTASTIYLFDRPGSLLFACHLPGHFAYGMHGTIRVRPA